MDLLYFSLLLLPKLHAKWSLALVIGAKDWMFQESTGVRHNRVKSAISMKRTTMPNYLSEISEVSANREGTQDSKYSSGHSDRRQGSALRSRTAHTRVRLSMEPCLLEDPKESAQEGPCSCACSVF